MSENKHEETPMEAEESDSLSEYLLGEEGGEWLWLLAPLLAGEPPPFFISACTLVNRFLYV